MDSAREGTRERLLSELEKREISIRILSKQTGINFTTVQSHLSGTAKNESLWFLRKTCDSTGISLPYVLFGVDLGERVSKIPVLNDKQVAKWIEMTPIRPAVAEWLPYPTMFASGSRVFAYRINSSDLSPQWPVGSWLYVDPDLYPEPNQRRLVLARVPEGGIIIRWLETLAGERWLVPQTEIHTSVALGKGSVLGSVVGGTKAVDL